MDDPKVLDRMRADWNQRASEDANYYVAFGRKEQDDNEFFATGSDIVRGFVGELKRLRAHEAALEIGCGPGRLMRPLAQYFTEIHGVDVSDEMIRLAKERLQDTKNAFVHVTSGNDLAQFPEGKFDFVYSYAVFQHIPSRDVVFNYLREARRVLKTGGILRCQINGLPAQSKQYDTWSGVRISPNEITAFTQEQELQILALDHIWTQYMWITCRKQASGWRYAHAGKVVKPTAAIRNITNALSGEAVAPQSGPSAALSVWVDGLPEECGLHTLTVLADGKPCRVMYIGEPDKDGLTQVNAALPEGLRTGFVTVEVRWLNQPLSEPAWVRIIPAGPGVPRIQSVSDGVNLCSGTKVVTRSVKVIMTDVADPTQFAVTVGGGGVLDLEAMCADPTLLRYEFNFRLPPNLRNGPQEVIVRLGKRIFAPFMIEVA